MDQDPPNRVREQEAVGEVCEAVEMVAFPAEQLTRRVVGQGTNPRIIRDLGVGIVRPDRVHGKEEEDSRIGDPGEDQAVIDPRASA